MILMCTRWWCILGERDGFSGEHLGPGDQCEHIIQKKLLMEWTFE